MQGRAASDRLGAHVRGRPLGTTTQACDMPPRLAVAHLLFTKKSSAAAARTRRASVDVAGSRYGSSAISTSTMRICVHGDVPLAGVNFL